MEERSALADRKGRPSSYDQATGKRELALFDEPPPEGLGKGGAVISRGLSHDSKNHSGAEAFAALTRVIKTAIKNPDVSTFDALHNLFRSKNQTPHVPEAPAPPS